MIYRMDKRTIIISGLLTNGCFKLKTVTKPKENILKRKQLFSLIGMTKYLLIRVLELLLANNNW